MTPCGLKYQRFGEAGCLHIQGCPIRWAFGCDGRIYFVLSGCLHVVMQVEFRVTCWVIVEL